MTTLLDHPTTVFAAPDDRTAAVPPERRGLRRDQVRLLVAGPSGLVDTQFHYLPDYLRAGDLLVVNNSATVPAETDGTLTGASGDHSVVVHVATRLTELPVVELRSAPDAASPVLDAKPGQRVVLAGPVTLTLHAAYPRPDSSPTGVGNRLWSVRVDGDLDGLLARAGRPIAYGYLDGRFDLGDYQTVFSAVPGSAEMASAARPFTPEVVARLVSRGVALAPITLHTGVSSQDAGEAPAPEWFEVSASTAAQVDATHATGGRVIAVGTTSTRALESAAQPDGTVVAASGWTDVVISPHRPVRVVDGLVTGWHNPDASHLLLVESVAGRELTQRAYDMAVANGYLWHEFGDAGLLLRC